MNFLKNPLTYVVALLAVFSLTLYFVDQAQTNFDRVKALEAEVKAVTESRAAEQAKEALKARMKLTVLDKMEKMKSVLSPLRRDILSTQIADSVVRIFEREDQMVGAITFLAIESGYNKFAQSPTGPRGIGQVAKAALAEGIKQCSTLAFKDEDVWDVEVNLLASLCYYKIILDGPAKQDVVSGIIGYNQGTNSADFKSYMAHGSLVNDEPKRYLARFVFLSKPTFTASAE